MQNRVKRNDVLRRLSCEMVSVKAMYDPMMTIWS